jgi:hypothetical protein
MCLLVMVFPAYVAGATTRGKITHVVIFWLKRPDNPQHRQALAHASEKFRGLPGVTRVDVGHALPVRRPGIEQRFDLCVVFTFKNQAALERFEKDPQHAAAVRAVLKPLVRRYVVFNSISD